MAFQIPTRGLLGFRTEFQHDTKGNGVLNSIFHSYVEYKGNIEKTTKGAIISMARGKTTSFALESLQSRGVLFVAPAQQVYEGMVIGEHSRETDCEVNPTKEKELSNVRTVMKEDKTVLRSSRTMGIEEAISYVRGERRHKSHRVGFKTLSCAQLNKITLTPNR